MIPENITQLAVMAISAHNDGRTRKKAREQLVEIEKYLQELLAKVPDPGCQTKKGGENPPLLLARL
ncbi:MAG: hypothetical protein DDT22_01054 [candidate division WS2 bacterium]|nr:hypothetical protein [Candidatus Lithacetigena glycinireducens]MBT9175379.1 hypothetical protein [Candidatus Lithacetigena glycinireducens]